MEETIERITKDAPWQIVQLFAFPYLFFASRYGKYGNSLTDFGCGEAPYAAMLQEQFTEVNLYDAEGDSRMGITKLDIRDLGSKLNSPTDIGFCFEVIEHIAPEEQPWAISSMLNLCNDNLIIGSVNRTGPNFYNDVEIFKAQTNTNDFHLGEMDYRELGLLCYKASINIEIIQSVWNHKKRCLEMTKHLSNNGLVNYAILTK